VVREHLPSLNSILIAIAVGVSIGILGIVGLEVATKYPSPDGLRMKDGQLLGGDFVAFYTSAALFRDDPELLYDLSHQREARRQVLGSEAAELLGDLPFVYPPLLAASISPLSRLSFERAFYVWAAIGFSTSFLSLLLLVRVSGATRTIPLPVLILGILGFVPYTFQTFFGGQASWIGLTILALTATSLLRQRDLLAGAVLSLSYYKPPLFIFLLVVLLLSRRREFIAGFALGALALLGSTLVVVGSDGVSSYVAVASRYIYGRELMAGVQLPPDQGMGLWALGVTLLPSMAATAAVLILPMLYTGRLAYHLLRSWNADDRHYGLILAITASLAFSVQLIKYDLAMLLVPMVLASAWAGGRVKRHWLAFAPFAAFYVEAAFRGLQFGERTFNASSVLFAVLLFTLACQGREVRRGCSNVNASNPTAD
jgi:hypothetical protein